MIFETSQYERCVNVVFHGAEACEVVILVDMHDQHAHALRFDAPFLEPKNPKRRFVLRQVAHGGERIDHKETDRGE
jgi:hypothetical protein